MSDSQPTLQSASWAMTGFLDTARKLLRHDKSSVELRLYFYAITSGGWGEIAADVRRWLRSKAKRIVIAYVGTDHALTDPPSLQEMGSAKVQVRLLRRYNGVFHPKLFWFVKGNRGNLLAGSNNLTHDGLVSNVEFATLTKLSKPDPNLLKWHNAVHQASDPLTQSLLERYTRERERFGKARASARGAATFTWSERSSSRTSTREGKPKLVRLGSLRKGDLILEVMPRETGVGGCQIQIPLNAAQLFFGLGHTAYSRLTLSLRNVMTKATRTLTMTRFGNATARLVIHELDYRDRPCILVFRSRQGNNVDFELIRESIDPDCYRALLARCTQRVPRRRWTIWKVEASK